ncbi:unnamed protein product [Albugo candida]|uniref:Uncharacterized protein n=1 Tax=Albugo candida TaxID=65357 RepID=A0A024G6U7_9STRA|nr:unnamed protein product [Albugo candida]|eukprot:CCI42284.1 unnamed protein product [Albugo candida]
MKTFGLLIAAGALATLNVEGLTRSTTLNTTNANSELGSSAAVNAPISSLKLEVDNTPGTKLNEDSMKDDKTDEDAEDGSGSGKDEIKKNNMADTPMSPTSQKSSANAVISSIGVVSACAIMASIMITQKISSHIPTHYHIFLLTNTSVVQSKFTHTITMKTFGYLIAAIAVAQANAQTPPPTTPQAGAPNNAGSPPSGAPGAPATTPQSSSTTTSTQTTTSNPGPMNPNMMSAQLGTAPNMPPKTENGNANDESTPSMPPTIPDQSSNAPTTPKNGSDTTLSKEEKKPTSDMTSGASLMVEKTDGKSTTDSPTDTSSDDTTPATSTSPSEDTGSTSGPEAAGADSTEKTSSAQSVMTSVAVVAISSTIMASFLV